MQSKTKVWTCKRETSKVQIFDVSQTSEDVDLITISKNYVLAAVQIQSSQKKTSLAKEKNILAHYFFSQMLYFENSTGGVLP